MYSCFVFNDPISSGTILPYPSMAGTLTVEILLVLLLAFIESVRLFFGKQCYQSGVSEERRGGHATISFDRFLSPSHHNVKSFPYYIYC